MSDTPRPYDLDEALELLAVLEEAGEELARGEALVLLMQIEDQVGVLHRGT